MAATLRDAFSKLIEYFKNMEKGRRNRFIALLLAGIVLVTAVSLALSKTEYTVLYSDLPDAEAGQIMDSLDSMGVKSKLESPGTILVDSSVVDRVRMRLASEGLPNSVPDNSVYERAMGIGTTEQDKQYYDKAQAQETLARSISTLEKVKNCTVIINYEKDSPFVLKNDKRPASAAVILVLEEGTALNEMETSAIFSIVSKAVQGLDPANISITDTMLREYKLKDMEDPLVYLTDQRASELEMQGLLKAQVENLLTPVFGAGKVKAEVNVRLDFDNKSSQEVVFESPVSGNDKGLEVSWKELYETINNPDAEGGVAGFEVNGAGNQYQEVEGNSDAAYSMISKEANAEVNEKRTQIESAKGQIRELSVAVLIDNSDEELEDYTENVKNLVANAIGVSVSYISVEMLPFREPAVAEGSSPMEMMEWEERIRREARQSELLRIGIVVATIVIVMVLLLLIARTFRKPSAVPALEGGFDLYADENMTPESAEALAAFMEQEDASLAQLEDYIDKSPEAVAQLLRNWLSDV